jgi:DNA-binding HxlR family transcriptional regulator
MTEFHEVGEIDPHRTRQVTDLIGGRWTLAVLAILAGGGRRYQDLNDALDGVSHNVLTATLNGQRPWRFARTVLQVMTPQGGGTTVGRTTRP